MTPDSLPADLAADIALLPAAALVTAVALAQGLFPEERAFIPVVPARRAGEQEALPRDRPPGNGLRLRGL